MQPRLWLAMTVGALTACTPRPAAAPAGTPAPAPAPPPVATAPIARGTGTDLVRLGPSALRYAVHQLIHVEQQFQGQTQTIDRGIRLFVTSIISGPADSLGYPASLTLDSIVPDSGSVIPPTVNLASARGLKYAGHLTSSGEFRQSSTSDSTIAQAFAQIVGGFRNFYPRLPNTGLTLGADWTDTTTTQDRAGIEVTIKATSHSRATTWEQRNATRSLRLEVRSAYTVVGSGDQGGQPLDVTGTGTRTSLQFIAIDGRYLGGEVRDSSSITVGLPLQGMTVPVLQISNSTITVLP